MHDLYTKLDLEPSLLQASYLSILSLDEIGLGPVGFQRFSST